MKEPRPYQVACWEAIRDAVSRGVRRQLCALAPGLGKSYIGSNIRAQLSVNRMLILAHRRELLTQWRNEIQESDPDATVAIEMGDVREADCDTDIVLGSVPTLCKPWRRHKLHKPYDVIQVDECFVAGTLVDGKPIETFVVGDSIGAWDEKEESFCQQKVIEVFQSRPSSLMTVRFVSGAQLVCTENHPIRTLAEYRAASSLRAGECVIRRMYESKRYSTTGEGLSSGNKGLRKLRQAGNPCRTKVAATFLLFGYMHEGVEAQGVFQTLYGILENKQIWGLPEQPHEARQPYLESYPSGEMDCILEENRLASARQGRQWNGSDCSAAYTCGTDRMGNGGCYFDERGSKIRLPNLLQGGCCQSGLENSNRSGWGFSPNGNTETARHEKAEIPGIDWVESLTFHEQTSDGTFGGMCPDGYVYNLNIEEHHNYFANGILVHNCDLSLARTWLETIKAFGVSEPNGPLLIGWTGTPYRHDGQELANLFDEVVFDMGLKAPPGGKSAIDLGYLCPARAIRVKSRVSIADIPVFGGDFNQEQLLQAVDVPERNDLIVTAIEEHAQDRDSILVFVTGVEQAKRLADTLRLRGHHAESVDGKTTPIDRSGILRRFGETGETRILVNVDILTRGTNIPRIDCIVEGHPTHSATRYIQGVSRAFRLSPETGKRDALIVDIVDVCGKHPVQTAAAVFGLRSIDALGQDLRIVQKVSETAEQLGIEVQDGDTVIDIVKKIGVVERVARQAMRVDTTAEAIDLFSATRLPGVVEQGSEFPWVQVKDAYCLMIDRDHRAILKRDECGIWGCAVNNGRPLGGLKIGQSPKPPFREADKVVKRFAGAWTTKDGFKVHRWKSISRKSKKWSQPPTPQQREALGRYGVRALPPGISSGAAYAMLSAIVLRKEANYSS